MQEIQEAFRRALEENPKSAIAQKVNAERMRLEEERGFAELRKYFKDVGFVWFGTNIDKSTGKSYEHNLITVEQKKEHYVQVLTTFKNRPFQQRIELLRALASGMHLVEDIAPADDANYRKFFRFVPLGYSGDNPLRISFTKPSAFFIEAIGDMSGHSREQQEKFREFMVREAGLKGKVGLPELFPGISRWLDHSNNSPFPAPNVREQHKT